MSNLISTGELASMRTQLAASLPGTAIISARTLTDDGQGGSTATWAATGTVSCRLSPKGRFKAGDEEVHGDRQTAVTDRIITLPYGTTVTVTGRIAVGSQTFEVTGLHSPRSYELCVRVDASQVD